MTHDTWGKEVQITGSLAGTLGALNPFRYRGYVYDEETGFYYLQSRYYDPTTCRFISADVLLSTGQGVLGHNAYAYCGDNPASRADPKGTSCMDLKDLFGGGNSCAGRTPNSGSEEMEIVVLDSHELERMAYSTDKDKKFFEKISQYVVAYEGKPGGKLKYFPKYSYLARGIHINFQKLIDALDWSEYPDWSPHDVAVRIAWYGMEKYSIAKKDEGWGDYVFKNADGENWSYWDKVYYDYFDYYYGWTERERYYVDYETIY